MTRRTRNQQGSGLLGTCFGVMVFLTLLFFAAHILLNLWVRSSVDAAAHDAALMVALATPADRADVSVQALQQARLSLGRYASRVTFEFEASPADRVVLHVRAPELRLLPPLVAQPLGFTGLDRRIVVHAEPT